MFSDLPSHHGHVKNRQNMSKLFMRLTPDSRAPAKADPAARAGVVVVVVRVGVGVAVAAAVVVAGVVGGTAAVAVAVVVVVDPVLALGCGCGCGCCWPMLALFGRSFAPVLALGWPM